MTGPNHPNYELEVVVAPFGIDTYPKYVVNFGNVVAFSCMEEMHFPERDFAELNANKRDRRLMSFSIRLGLSHIVKGNIFCLIPMVEIVNNYVIF